MKDKEAMKNEMIHLENKKYWDNVHHSSRISGGFVMTDSRSKYDHVFIDDNTVGLFHCTKKAVLLLGIMGVKKVDYKQWSYELTLQEYSDFTYIIK